MIYKRRTSIERSNKREKIDFNLESGIHRSTKIWYIRIYATMIYQHIDAWFSRLNDSLADLKSFIFPKNIILHLFTFHIVMFICHAHF